MPRRIRVNEQIRWKEIRLIGANGEQLGVVPVSEGLKVAKESELDLVEVAPAARPPVCRVMDYSKYKYDQEKKEKKARKQQRTFQVKEIKLKPNIEEHDYQTKLRHLQRFLKKGNKAKVILVFRGREMAHMDLGKRVLERFAQDLSAVGEVERAPVLEGRAMTMIFAPK